MRYLLAAILAALLGFSMSHCVHDEFIAQHPVVPHVSNVPYRTVTKEDGKRSTSSFEGLRVHYYTTELESDLASNSAMLALLKDDILPKTARRFQEILKVNPVVGNLKIDRTCVSSFSEGSTTYCVAYSDLVCSEFGAIPDRHYSTQNIYSFTKTITGTTAGGVGISNADLVIYVTAKNTNTCVSSSSTLAYATHCSQDAMDRPIAGYVNFCPNTLSIDDTEKIFYTTMHEVGHILGISYSLYPYYRNSDGSAKTKRQVGTSGYIYDVGVPPSTPDTNTMQTFTERGKSVKKIVAEPALTKVREHFNCMTLDGLELEDQGGAGTATSHPEMRMFYNDFMNGYYPSFPVISPVSLAFFESTGWYEAVYEKADFHSWGYQLGCEFVSSKCLVGSGPTPVDDIHFCTSEQQTIRCTQDLKGMGVCQTANYITNLDSEFQYFSDPKRGGSIALIDYCPIYETFNFNSGGVYPAGRSICSNANGAPYQNSRGETYGTNSKCVVNTLLASEYVGSQNSRSGGCFQMDCKSTYVRILVGDTFVKCGINDKGNSRSTGNYKGSFTCPDYSVACPPSSISTCTKDCGDHGYCDGDVCVCARGWDGVTCNTYVGAASSIAVSISLIIATVIAHLLIF